MKDIDTGPYAIVRHPMYLGSIFWLAGLALVLESTATALATLPIVVLGFLLLASNAGASGGPQRRCGSQLRTDPLDLLLRGRAARNPLHCRHGEA